MPYWVCHDEVASFAICDPHDSPLPMLITKPYEALNEESRKEAHDRFTMIAPILNSPVLAPAFDNILPALFGGLAVVYVSKNWKIAMAPLIFMVVLFLAVPSLASSVGVLVPVGVLIALGAARLMYKKGWV